MLLLHEFHDRKFLLPDKLSQREKEQVKKHAVVDMEEVCFCVGVGVNALPLIHLFPTHNAHHTHPLHTYTNPRPPTYTLAP